ncbi:MAG: NAD(P)H-binding protein [Gammaproteobacteria bacterium]|nr:NAD(P)H-binding protein [Gammaproteobacteria bacterium]MDH5730171.1 NAD(P)H-binding protein [Gammaproteobacteria bacterium]
MRTALVMGITGSFGAAVAQALAAQGWSIKALVREPAKCVMAISQLELVQGDASNIEDVRCAAQGVQLMVYGVNPSNYDWEHKALPWLDVAAQVAEEFKLSLVFPGNVYVLNPAHGSEFDEQALLQPISRKGEIRLCMEQRLEQASRHGARIIIFRMGDFIGCDAKSSWMPFLIKQNDRGIVLLAPGPMDIEHSYAYLPDAAKTVALLCDKTEQLKTFNVFHFRGHRFSFTHLAQVIRQNSNLKVKQKKFVWWPIQLLAPVVTLFRGMNEMAYLWSHVVNLNEQHLQQVLGVAIPHTDLYQALCQSKLISDTNRSSASIQTSEA